MQTGELPPHIRAVLARAGAEDGRHAARGEFDRDCRATDCDCEYCCAFERALLFGIVASGPRTGGDMIRCQSEDLRSGRHSTQPLEAPWHGQTRHYGYTTDVSAGGWSAVTDSIVDTYCGRCGQWISTNGVLGPLRFMATHRDGDCAQGA